MLEEVVELLEVPVVLEVLELLSLHPTSKPIDKTNTHAIARTFPLFDFFKVISPLLYKISIYEWNKFYFCAPYSQPLTLVYLFPVFIIFSSGDCSL